MFDKESFLKVYALFDEAGPAPYDCGKLCHELCCRPDEMEGGDDAFLTFLPGEECVHDPSDPWLSWTEDWHLSAYFSGLTM